MTLSLNALCYNTSIRDSIDSNSNSHIMPSLVKAITRFGWLLGKINSLFLSIGSCLPLLN